MITTKYMINSKLLNFSQESPMRIVQLSDLHKKRFGDGNSKLIQKVRELRPDIIIITGDMVSRTTTDLSDLKKLISGIKKTADIYYSLGNHEKDLKKISPSVYKNLIKFLKKHVHLLDNTTETIKFRDNQINITGLTIYQDCYKKNGRYKDLRKLSADDVSALAGNKKPGFNILLAHNPFFFESYSEYGSELILSGHVHGGIIRLPFIGGLLSPERKFFPEYSSGIFQSGNSAMIVSRGLGKFRLFNPSEIILIEIV